MTRYLLIQSRDPFDSGEVANQYAITEGLAAGGGQVTLFLVQNGVLPARPCGASAALSALAAKGVEVLADVFSLRERGIAADRLAEGVKPAPLDVVIDRLAAGDKVIWH